MRWHVAAELGGGHIADVGWASTAGGQAAEYVAIASVTTAHVWQLKGRADELQVSTAPNASVHRKPVRDRPRGTHRCHAHRRWRWRPCRTKGGCARCPGMRQAPGLQPSQRTPLSSCGGLTWQGSGRCRARSSQRLTASMSWWTEHNPRSLFVCEPSRAWSRACAGQAATNCGSHHRGQVRESTVMSRNTSAGCANTMLSHEACACYTGHHAAGSPHWSLPAACHESPPFFPAAACFARDCFSPCMHATYVSALPQLTSPHPSGAEMCSPGNQQDCRAAAGALTSRYLCR